MSGSEGLQDRPAADVFDLDRTVTHHSTFIPFLWFVAQRRPHRLLLLPAILLTAVLYCLGLVSRGGIKILMLTCILGGVSRATVERHAVAFVARCVKGGLRPGARQAIAKASAEGRTLVLATASFDFYVEPLARQLGFHKIVATRAAWSTTGRLTGRIDGENCYGAEKLRRLEQALPELKRSHRVTAYSDSHADLPLLSWADHGVAVNPSRRLRQEAQAAGLETVDWGVPTDQGPHREADSAVV